MKLVATTGAGRLAVQLGIFAVQIALTMLNLAAGNPRVAAFTAFVAGWSGAFALVQFLDLRRAA